MIRMFFDWSSSIASYCCEVYIEGFIEEISYENDMQGSKLEKNLNSQVSTPA